MANYPSLRDVRTALSVPNSQLGAFAQTSAGRKIQGVGALSPKDSYKAMRSITGSYGGAHEKQRFGMIMNHASSQRGLGFTAQGHLNPLGDSRSTVVGRGAAARPAAKPDFQTRVSAWRREKQAARLTVNRNTNHNGMPLATPKEMMAPMERVITKRNSVGAIVDDPSTARRILERRQSQDHASRMQKAREKAAARREADARAQKKAAKNRKERMTKEGRKAPGGAARKKETMQEKLSTFANNKSGSDNS